VVSGRHDDVLAIGVVDVAREQVGLTEEVGDERGARQVVELGGGPICSIFPWFMTATVSAMVMASSWSWVTWMKVRPTSVWMRLSSTCI
jgi:hypothetical protein